MAKLTDEVKTFIVQELAQFNTPTQVAAAVAEEFGITIDRSHVRKYNPQQVKVKQKWVAIFDATRAKFLSTTADISVAHRAFRLRKLANAIEKAETMKNYALLGTLLEQAAKEVGDVFTNRQRVEHSDPDGKNPFVAGVTVTITGSATPVIAPTAPDAQPHTP